MVLQQERSSEDVLKAINNLKAQAEAQQIALEVVIFSICSEVKLPPAKLLSDLDAAYCELEHGLVKGSQLVGAFYDLRKRLRHLLMPESEVETG
ncbi:hypothetical protein [Microvirga puerhi]|uniref:Uncharacterized protein n=1 Tax=Microvirga puerhi TaxID=2876078 RepID=A0ABS7VRC4_9HYPH|nr:hypothetical protein [Microvirga puerhi]MBZ6078101.1 hypothetical protein [Microvirga puerhi]